MMNNDQPLLKCAYSKFGCYALVTPDGMNAHIIDDASVHASLVRSAFKVELAARKQCQKQLQCLQSRMQSREVEVIQLRADNERLMTENAMLRSSTDAARNALSPLPSSSHHHHVINNNNHRDFDTRYTSPDPMPMSSPSSSSDNDITISRVAAATIASMDMKRASSLPSSAQDAATIAQLQAEITLLKANTDTTSKQQPQKQQQQQHNQSQLPAAAATTTTVSSKTTTRSGKGGNGSKKKSNSTGKAKQQKKKRTTSSSSSSSSSTVVTSLSKSLSSPPSGTNSKLAPWAPLISSSLLPSSRIGGATGIATARLPRPFVNSFMSSLSSSTSAPSAATSSQPYGPAALRDCSWDNEPANVTREEPSSLSPFPLWPVKKSESSDEPLYPRLARRGGIEDVVAGDGTFHWQGPASIATLCPKQVYDTIRAMVDGSRPGPSIDNRMRVTAAAAAATS